MERQARNTRPPVVVVTGPTSAGKTTLAIALALRVDGEIVNADSMQIYRYMDIGTAKPTPEQRARVPHHLLDVVTPDVPYDAGRYAREARAAARAIHERGRAVFLTGGTGLYIRAFLEGLYIPFAPGRADGEQSERCQDGKHENRNPAFCILHGSSSTRTSNPVWVRSRMSTWALPLRSSVVSVTSMN